MQGLSARREVQIVRGYQYINQISVGSFDDI